MKEKTKLLKFLLVLCFVSIGVFFRLMPHPPNFTPIAAIALFGGVYLSKKTAIILPVLAMIISDLFIGSYEIKLMVAVYFSFILTVFLGFWLKNNRKWHTIVAGSFISALLFFIITNFAVWAFTMWYPKTVSGLLYCYFMALPFLKNSLMGDLFYTGIFFGIYEMTMSFAENRVGALKRIFPKLI